MIFDFLQYQRSTSLFQKKTDKTFVDKDISIGAFMYLVGERDKPMYDLWNL